MTISTVDENGVRCSVWTGQSVIYVSAQSTDAKALAELSLQLEQRGYNIEIAPITDRAGRFLGAYSLSGEKRIGAAV